MGGEDSMGQVDMKPGFHFDGEYYESIEAFIATFDVEKYAYRDKETGGEANGYEVMWKLMRSLARYQTPEEEEQLAARGISVEKQIEDS